jgi:hypothetical protein
MHIHHDKRQAGQCVGIHRQSVLLASTAQPEIQIDMHEGMNELATEKMDG